jgi:hypothetical protein
LLRNDDSLVFYDRFEVFAFDEVIGFIQVQVLKPGLVDFGLGVGGKQTICNVCFPFSRTTWTT